MNIEKAEKIIADNYNCINNSFVFSLHEECRFSIEKFWEYYDSIAFLAGVSEKSPETSMMIHQSYHSILKEFIYHFDPMDVIIEDFPENYIEYIERIDFALIAYYTGNINLLDDKKFELQK